MRRDGSDAVAMLRVLLGLAVAEAVSWPLLGPTLRVGGDDAFAELVAPVAVAVNLSYVATSGSYYDPAAANATPGPAWAKAALEADPADGGMRALGWLHADGARAIVAFRGTDLDPRAPSGRADACADALLFRGPGAVPAWCAREFGAAQLDYFARAVDYARAFEAAHPRRAVLYTGHSLGAALAALVALDRGGCDGDAPALAFSWGGLAGAARNRTGCDLRTVDRARVAQLANPYDPVFVDGDAPGERVGGACVWRQADEPRACAGDPCRDGATSLACGRCFAQAHVFAQYLRLVDEGARPTCDF